MSSNPDSAISPLGPLTRATSYCLELIATASTPAELVHYLIKGLEKRLADERLVNVENSNELLKMVADYRELVEQKNFTGNIFDGSFQVVQKLKQACDFYASRGLPLITEAETEIKVYIQVGEESTLLRSYTKTNGQELEPEKIKVMDDYLNAWLVTNNMINGADGIVYEATPNVMAMTKPGGNGDLKKVEPARLENLMREGFQPYLKEKMPTVKFDLIMSNSPETTNQPD
jgi:hypothetical protein